MKNINDYILEKLYIGKDSKFNKGISVIQAKAKIKTLLRVKYKIDSDDIFFTFRHEDKSLEFDIYNYKDYYNKGIIPDQTTFLKQLTNDFDRWGIEVSEEPKITLGHAFSIIIDNLEI